MTRPAPVLGQAWAATFMRAYSQLPVGCRRLPQFHRRWRPPSHSYPPMMPPPGPERRGRLPNVFGICPGSLGAPWCGEEGRKGGGGQAEGRARRAEDGLVGDAGGDGLSYQPDGRSWAVFRIELPAVRPGIFARWAQRDQKCAFFPAPGTDEQLLSWRVQRCDLQYAYEPPSFSWREPIDGWSPSSNRAER